MKISFLSRFLVFTMLAVLVFVLAEDNNQDDDLTYEEKLLKKLILMEERMGRLDKALETSKLKYKTTIQDQTKVFDNKTAQLELLQEKIDFPLIAFNAYGPRDYSPDTNQIHVWTGTRVNEGNAYDATTGIFNAPVTGLYYFAVHTCNYGGVENRYAIVKENTDIATTYQYDNAVNDCHSMSSITMLTAEQRVWVRCVSGGSTSNQLWESYGRSSFIGALIHK